MPILPCPNCGKKMSVPDTADGKKVRCPGCSTILVASDDGLELAPRTAARAPAPARGRDDDDEPRPRRSRRDDEDYDDDDRPRKKRRSDDDDDRNRPRKKKSGGGIPLWAWLTGSGVLVGGIVLVLVLFVFGGNKFSRVKEGMSEKEVRDMLGPPTEDGFGVAVWYDPPLKKEDMMDPKKASQIKEVLVVQFENGKVKSKQLHKASDYGPGGRFRDP